MNFAWPDHLLVPLDFAFYIVLRLLSGILFLIKTIPLRLLIQELT